MKPLLLPCVCAVSLLVGCSTNEPPAVEVGKSFAEACDKLINAGGKRVIVPLDLTVPEVAPPHPGEAPKPPLYWDHAIFQFKSGQEVTLWGLHGKITRVETRRIADPQKEIQPDEGQAPSMSAPNAAVEGPSS